MPSIQHTRTVHFLKAGPAGPKGDDGAAYWLVAEPSSVVRRKDGTLSAESVSVTAYKSVGGAVSLAAEGWLEWHEYHGEWAAEKSVSASQTRTVPVPASRTSVRVRLTTHRHGGETLASVTIPIVEDGQPGQAGERGAIIRELVWEDMPSDFVFYEGAEGEPYQDKVLYRAEGHYLCVHTHVKGEEGDDPPHCSWWQEVDYWPAIATKVLLARKAKIPNLQVSEVQLLDDGEDPRTVACYGKIDKNGIELKGRASFGGAVSADTLSLSTKFPQSGDVLSGALNVAMASADACYFLPEVADGSSIIMDVMIYQRGVVTQDAVVMTLCGVNSDVLIAPGGNVYNPQQSIAVAGKTGLFRLIGFSVDEDFPIAPPQTTLWTLTALEVVDGLQLSAENPQTPPSGSVGKIDEDGNGWNNNGQPIGWIHN